MDKATDIKALIEDQRELTKQLTEYYRTTQTEILRYIFDHLEMGEAELKMCLALYVEGRTLNASQFAIITALHPNTIRQHLFGQHVQAVREMIIDEMLEDEHPGGG